MADKKIGHLSLTLMGVMSIYSLINMPIMARYGMSSIICYIIAALIFFIPNAIVCAELASAMPEAGGVYVWIKEAFGIKTGYLCMWLEWINNVIVFPASLSFTATIISHLLPAQMQLNQYATLMVMLALFWIITFVNFRGIRFSSKLSNLGFIFGTLLPSMLLITLGMWWGFNSITNHTILTTNWASFDIHMPKSSFLVSMIMGYSGIQVIAFHAQDVKNPRKDYPLAILSITIITLCLYVFGSAAIFTVIPAKDINIIDGFNQALEGFLTNFNLVKILPLIIFLMVLGRLSSLSMWVIGPARGLAAALGCSEGLKNLSYTNRHGVPTKILFTQAVITTILSLLYIFVSNISDIYWILLALSSAFTLIMYMLIFAAGIALRYLKPNIIRPYRVPGGKIGIWVIAGCGLVTSFFVMILCFLPPESLYVNSSVFYKEIMIIGLIAILTVPMILALGKVKQCKEDD